MLFKDILFGTQYYRSPTPLKDEWESDLAEMRNYSLDVFQIRINWRNNERERGIYDFSDVDGLLELAKKNGLKVCMKFLLECAPQYVFDELKGERIGPKGETLRGGYHGAFFGGFKPCFNNPEVRKAAESFVETVVARYRDNENIVLWNVWNEPRNRPVEECFCPHCRRAFGQYLRKKFGTIKRLNDYYGATEQSFERINLPAMAHGYWDIFEFKKFQAGETQYNNLRFVYDAIRKYDDSRPIMSHVGFTAAFQYRLGDVCDDFTAKKAVDFWGTSIPFDTDMSTNDRRLDMQLLLDFMRAVDENFFLYEIYPGLGMFRWYDTRFDMNFKLYSALSCGAKGMFFWQYRAERVGNENDCAGIMRADGSPRPVAFEVRDFGTILKNDMPYFASAKAEKADIGVVFDFDCSLMSIIEDGSLGELYTFEAENAVKYYNESHKGAYKLFRNAGYPVDYVPVKETHRFSRYKVLYLPYQCFISEELETALEKFVNDGGTLIADEGFGLRTPNTWLNPYDINFSLLKARVKERRYLLDKEELEILGEKVRISGYKSVIESQSGKELASFKAVGDEYFDEKTAFRIISAGKGKIYLSGVALGYSYSCGEKKLISVMKKILPENLAAYRYSDTENGVYERNLVGKNGERIMFIMNASENDFRLKKKADVIKIGAEAKDEDGYFVVPARSSGYIITEAERR